MKSRKKRSFFDGTPSSVWALIAAIVSMVLLIVVAEVLGTIPFFSKNFGEPGAYGLYVILIASANYFICRHDPKSVWYVPLISNVASIISAIAEPTFWTTYLGIFMGGALILSIIAGILGATKGKKMIQVQD